MNFGLFTATGDYLILSYESYLWALETKLSKPEQKKEIFEILSFHRDNQMK